MVLTLGIIRIRKMSSDKRIVCVNMYINILRGPDIYDKFLFIAHSYKNSNNNNTKHTSRLSENGWLFHIWPIRHALGNFSGV